MAWPWVSREQHEETKKLMQNRVDELTRDRDRVLDILLGGAVPDRRPEIRAVERQTDDEPETGPAAATEQAQSYANPFDSIEKRFDRAFAGGVIPATFKARMN